MITWILGRSGVGKTEYLMRQLPQLAATHRQVLYLTPEQGSMGLEQELGAMGLGNVKALSFRRLCNEIFRTFGGVAGSYMTAARETALIYRVLTERQKDLVYYKDARPTMGFVGRLSGAFSELALSGLTRDAVFPLLEQSGRPDWLRKYDDLFTLYDAYRGALDEENRSAAEDLAEATALARERGYFKEKAVILDGFFGFTGRQRALLQVIFEQAPNVSVAFLLDPKDPSLLFSSAKREFAGLCRLAGEREQTTVTLPGPSHRLQYSDLQQLEQNLFSTRPNAVKAEHIRLMVGRNIREELAMVAIDIAKKVREGGYRYRDFALAAGDLSEYGPVAEAVFAKYGVPLFVDGGRASISKPIFAFVQSALRIISPERYFRREDVLIFLKTGLCGEERDRISLLENYCTLWQIDGERFVREADWTQNPKGQGRIDEEGAALLAELNALRQRIREPLLRFREKAARGSGAALAEAVYGLLCDFKVEKHIAARAKALYDQSGAGGNAWELQQKRRLGMEYLKLYSTMTAILDDIYLVFGEKPLSIYAMEELIGLCGEETAINLTPPTQDAVTMGEVTHSRLKDVRFLYVVGANQGLLPKPVSADSLIGERERQLFVANELPCNATLSQNTLQAQHRLYATVFSAREELTFSYSAFKMDGEVLLPSVYVDKLRRITDLTPMTMEGMDRYDFAVTREGARELVGQFPAMSTAILRELQEEPLPAYQEEDRLPREVVRRIFGDRLRLSYSQISLYQNCPFHYFMDKTMSIKKSEPITFDAANIGTFVHYGMEKLTAALIEEGYNYDKYNSDEIKRFGEKLATEYLQDQLRDFNQTNRFASLYRRMTSLFCLVAENVMGELREGKFRPYGTEFSLEGVCLPLKNGAEVQLIGSVDRVDTYEVDGKTYLKVTDYKTGSKSFDLCGVTNRDGVQLPIYLYGLMKSGNWKAPIPAVGCYMEAKTPAFTEAIRPEELEKKLKGFYKRNGAFPSEKTVLEGLDAAGGSNYFKIGYTKDGELDKRTKVYDLELMQEMTDYMETVICETAEGILAGNVAAHPLKGKDHNACQYCEFAGVCRFDEENGKKRYYSEEPLEWREEQ
ncbi:MAG: PD-(D/E)XK nuclease family protein [Clostridia bacterium]|nr:PD-(D/E)XK nuclease family protein [Clostridia bacterium]